MFELPNKNCKIIEKIKYTHTHTYIYYINYLNCLHSDCIN